jgi:hypothetical protein
MIMKQQLIAAAFVLGIVQSVGAQGLSKEKISDYATSLQFDVSKLMQCGDAYGGSYRGVAERLSEKLLTLVDLSGYDAQVFAETQNRKIETIYGRERRERAPEQRSCDLLISHSAEADMDADIRRLEPKASTKNSPDPGRGATR